MHAHLLPRVTLAEVGHDLAVLLEVAARLGPLALDLLLVGLCHLAQELLGWVGIGS